jgi:signal transduction histidine kinase
MKRRVSLRLRLALLSSALLAATLLGFSVFVYFVLANALTTEVDRALVDRANVLIRSMRASPTPLGLLVDPPDVDAISGAVAQAVLFNGQVARSALLERADLELPVSREALAAARDRRTRFEVVKVAGVDLRVYNVPLVLDDNRDNRAIGILQVARPIGPTEAALARLQLVLVVGTAASVVVCILVGLVFARAALRPIDRLTREAEHIGESQDFGRRVPETGADEVGRLAATFNGMLDRLQSAYAALQTANRRLAAALESQRRFVADASHELRTPLTTVRGNASLLRRFDVLTPEDRQAAVGQIAAEAERMSRLVSDLLTLARADAGQLLERKPVALRPLLDAVAQQGRVLAEGKVAISVVALADAAGAAVVGDADALRQLVLILVDNAIKYTPAGGSVTLGLRLEAAPPEVGSGQWAVGSGDGGDGRDSGDGGGGRRTPGGGRPMKMACLSVADTGAGIAREDLPHIFERFYRADRARRTGGTGLGLAIGKWIAEAHGGTIEVESSPGAGSIFTVRLPASPAGSADGCRRAPEVEPAAATARA